MGVEDKVLVYITKYQESFLFSARGREVEELSGLIDFRMELVVALMMDWILDRSKTFESLGIDDGLDPCKYLACKFLT